jgi:hypothetical protein
MSIYGEPWSDKKDLTWRSMRILDTHTRRAWLMCGDFNEILTQHEKQGGKQRPQICMDKFQQTLEDGELSDLGLTGDTFTRRNNNQCFERYI